MQNRTPEDDPGGSAESSGIRMIKKGKEKNLQGKKKNLKKNPKIRALYGQNSTATTNGRDA